MSSNANRDGNATPNIVSINDVQKNMYIRELKVGPNLSLGLFRDYIILDALIGPNAPIGVPIDGVYGTSFNPAGLISTDSIADAFDKVSVLLEKLGPTAPDILSSITLTIPNSYSAFVQGTSTLVSNVQNDLLYRPSTDVTGLFFNSLTGSLNAMLKIALGGVPQSRGSIPLSGVTAGTTNVDLTVVTSQDFHDGDPQNEGFYQAITARIDYSTSLVPSSSETYTMQLTTTDSVSGNTPILIFYQDNAGNGGDLSVTNNTITSVTHTSGSYVSGIPTLETGDSLNVEFRVNNAIKKFYHNTAVGIVSGTFITDVNILPTGADRNEGSNPLFMTTAIVSMSGYTEDASVSCIAQNSAGEQVSSNTISNVPGAKIRIDSVSLLPSTSEFLNEGDRLESGMTDFAYTGTTFDPTISIAGTRELQVINGVYQYPPLVDYTNNIPPGPDYSGLTGFRYVTYNLGTITDEDFVYITIKNPVNFPTGANLIIPNFVLLVRVVGSTSYIDGNAYYPGVGNPTADGDPALVYDESTVIKRRITFGQATYSGQLIVKMGIAQTETLQWTGVEFSSL